MMEMENNWFHFYIEKRSKEFKDYRERIQFLYEEKSKFLSGHQGGNTNQVLLKFDNLIEKEKSLLDLNKIDDFKNKTEAEIFVDYSDNSKAEKIVFLHELGILEYLINKMNKEIHGFSTNKLAEIVSTFTGVPQVTAQSYLNPIYSKGADQLKTPLTEKNLKKVKGKLINIGFNYPNTM